MYVSMDFYVDSDEITPEEAIRAARSFCAAYSPQSTEAVKVPRGANTIEVPVKMLLVRASDTPLEGM